MASKDIDQIEYNVKVTGLEQATVQADTAAKTADKATTSLNNAQNQAKTSLRPILQTVRSLNAARLAVQQTSKAINHLDPSAALYAFLNMIQVVYNLTNLMALLQKSTAGASAAQAALAVLTGKWWLIPLALAAMGVVYSRIQSFESGGYIGETGVYNLHKGEYVVPSRSVAHNSFGPIFVSLPNSAMTENVDTRELVRTLGPDIVRNARRGG